MSSFKIYKLFRHAFFECLTLIFYSNKLSSYNIPFQKLRTNSIFVSQKMKLMRVWIVLFKYGNGIISNLSVVFRTCKWSLIPFRNCKVYKIRKMIWKINLYRYSHLEFNVARKRKKDLLPSKWILQSIEHKEKLGS